MRALVRAGHLLRRCAAAAVATLAMVGLVVLPALAHEEEGPDPAAAEAVAPGFTAMGGLILAAIVLGVWYYLRRQSMLRKYRRP